MTKPLIQEIVHMAKNMFARQQNGSDAIRLTTKKECTSSDLKGLISLVKRLSFYDVGLQHSKILSMSTQMFNAEKISTESKEPPNKQKPMSQCVSSSSRISDPVVIDIYKGRDITVGIFILPAGAKLPLHNHPNMTGIIKVVIGQLSISCFNKISDLSFIESEMHKKVLMSNGISSSLKTLVNGGTIIPSQCTQQNKTISSLSSPLVLMPNIDNYHEISNNSGQPAAFVDILAPPYNENGIELSKYGDSETRNCDFYEEIDMSSTINTDLVWLQNITDSVHYNCTIEPYLGPKIDE